jgi:hypothetical protein
MQRDVSMLTFEGSQILGVTAIVEKLVVRRVVLVLSCIDSSVLGIEPAVPESPTQGHDNGRTALHRRKVPH